jgi:MOSC domain-containing protein YiiM
MAAMADQGQTIEIVSVNVAMPAVLLGRPSGDIVSGIDKRPVAEPSLRLTAINLEGDGQADTKESRFGGQVHGGPDQAVYAFPVEHYSRFEATLERPVAPGFVGENLTVRGATEAEVRIGDVWQWGEALLQVTGPRSPCYKLGIRMGRQALRRWVREQALVGWYLRVLRPGIVPTAGRIVVAERHPAGVTVLTVHRALDGGGIGPDYLQDLEPLAEKARRKLQVAGRDVTGGVPERDG